MKKLFILYIMVILLCSLVYAKHWITIDDFEDNTVGSIWNISCSGNHSYKEDDGKLITNFTYIAVGSASTAENVF